MPGEICVYPMPRVAVTLGRSLKSTPCSLRADDVEEELVDAGVVAKFGMERGGEETALTDECG